MAHDAKHWAHVTRAFSAQSLNWSSWTIKRSINPGHWPFKKLKPYAWGALTIRLGSHARQLAIGSSKTEALCVGRAHHKARFSRAPIQLKNAHPPPLVDWRPCAIVRVSKGGGHAQSFSVKTLALVLVRVKVPRSGFHLVWRPHRVRSACTTGNQFNQTTNNKIMRNAINK